MSPIQCYRHRSWQNALYPRKIPLHISHISTLTTVFSTESTFLSIAVTAHSWREDLKCNLFPVSRHRLVVQILLADSFQYSSTRAGQLLTRFPSGMACTEAISVLLYWLRDVVGRQFQDTPDTSQRAQPAFATQCSRPIMAAQAPEYTSPPAMEVPVKGMSCSVVMIAMNHPRARHVEPKLNYRICSRFLEYWRNYCSTFHTGIRQWEVILHPRTSSQPTSDRIRPRANEHYARNSNNGPTSREC